MTGSKKSEVPSSRRIIEKPPVYYVTLKVRNRAGKKSIIAPSYRGLNQGFHINTGSIMKITREFQSAEPLILKAFDPDSHSQMMINNRKSIIVKPAKLRDRVTDVVISPLSKCFCGVVVSSFFSLLILSSTICFWCVLFHFAFLFFLYFIRWPPRTRETLHHPACTQQSGPRNSSRAIQRSQGWLCRPEKWLP